MSFPKYPAYKPSGVEWLGEVPAHWEVKRLRNVVNLNPSKQETAHIDRAIDVSFLPMEAIGEDGSIVLDRVRPIGELESGYTYFRNGDVAIAKITPCFENGKGAVMQGLLNGYGFGTTELIVARPKAGFIESSYLHRIFSSFPFRQQGEACMYGAGGQKRVPDDFVRDFAIALPSVDEQRLIESFLTRETTKIDALIAEQEQLITLLKEKRQAVISHAVTKGLDASAPMKDSGVAWLGEVPAHWGLCPLKSIASFRSGGTPDKKKPEYWDGEIPWLSAKDMKVDRLIDSIDHITQLAIEENSGTLVPAGAIVVVVRGMILARYFPVGQLARPMAINQDLKALIPRDGINPTYLAWVLRASEPETLNCLDEAGHGTKALRMENWAGITVPVPSAREQAEIAQKIDALTAELDQLMSEATRSIRLLGERRSALISAAVTGQIDVRAAV